MQFHPEHSSIGTEPTFELLHKLFELKAKQFPERTAIIFKNEFLTYKELNERADNLCHAILNWAYYEDVIAISSRPGIEMIIGVMAILKSGKAFMPLDPAAKHSRNAQIVKDSSVSFCLAAENDYEAFVDHNLKVIFSDSMRSYPVISGHRQGRLAYLMYTSGSTCQPKGVKVTHLSLLHYLRHGISNYTDSFSKSGSFMHLPLTFDAALTSLFIPLLCGKSLVLASGNRSDCFTERNFLEQAPYDFIKLTPLQLGWLENAVSNQNHKNICSRLVIGGETLHSRQLDFLRNKGLDLRIINEYGPTETTVGCMNFEFGIDDVIQDSHHGVPIGRAIPGMEVMVLDEFMNRVAPGEIGEIFIAGPQVSEGYLMRPELNDQLFIRETGQQKRKLFKTGDHALAGENGSITYIDRAEYHLKINGQWADPDLIEWELSRQKGIKQCKVVFRTLDDGSKKLIAYVMPDHSGFDAEQVRLELNQQLPSHMVPDKFLMVSHWPCTASGKLNRHALPLPDCMSKKTNQFKSPETDLEKQIAIVWRHVLNLDHCDIESGFFEMGGSHSQAERFIRLMKKHFEMKLDMQMLFNCSSISCLAAEIARQNQAGLVSVISVRDLSRSVN